MTLGQRLKALRESRDMSRQELADRCGVSYWALSKYENDERIPDHELLKKLASLFDVSLDYLLGRTDDPRGIQAEDEERSRELDKLLAGEQIYLNGEALTVEEKQAILDFIRLVKRAKGKAGEPES